MPRGLTKKGRARASLVTAASSARPLLRAVDHGEPFAVRAADVAASGDRWVESFLAANLDKLRRLDLRHEVRADPELRLMLRPGARIGAIPLLSPSTRRVAAGLLIEPRFRWSALGAVFNAIGFSVEPSLGGAPLVPGSAREVPPWLLAGAPVIEGLLHPLRPAAAPSSSGRRPGPALEDESSGARGPRGILPRGAWASFPCCYSEPDDDPDLMASVRWTLARLEEDLSSVVWSFPARFLLRRTGELRTVIGPGVSEDPRRRPGATSPVGLGGAAAMEAMTWVAEERGLGGARSLDGLAWDLSIDAVWEAWVAAFSADLAGRLGLTASPFQEARRVLRWQGPASSMGALAPDVELRGADRVIWIDAKYKAHLELLARRGWSGLTDEVREAHRADLHQALAYASLADVPQVDSLLVYPQLGGHDSAATIATVTSGRRRVRLVLASVPFGYRNPDHQERCLRSFREDLLAA